VRVTGRRAYWARRSFSVARAASYASQARSKVRATSQFSGSTASYHRRARSASYRTRSEMQSPRILQLASGSLEADSIMNAKSS
jgi:hypothetical protein